MNTNYKILSLIVCLAGFLSAEPDAALISDHFFETAQYEKKFSNRKITTKLEKGEEKRSFIANVLMEGVHVYKDYISPQDMDMCTFHPSCSEYAFLCLKHQSFPEAVLNSGDRLMRCYSGNHIYYSKDPITKLNENYPDTLKKSNKRQTVVNGKKK